MSAPVAESGSSTGMVKRRRQPRRIGARPADLQNGADQLARAIEQIDIALQRAQRDIRTDARDRLRQLCAETRQAADRALKEAHKIADSIIERCRPE